MLANLKRDPDKRPRPWTPADFMPGAKSEEDEWLEFTAAIARGDSFEVDQDMVDDFKKDMIATFANVGSQPQNEKFA